MLNHNDELLAHQTSSPMTIVDNSDPRFYDRHWIAVYDEDGRFALQGTLAVYPNMNVADAALVMIHDGRQYNVRASRSLRPDFAMQVGPFGFDILDPFRHVRFMLEGGDHQMAAQLDWMTEFAVEEEPHHLERKRGRAIQDWHRYDQLGTCSGWVDLPTGRVLIDQAWAARDHSWGVRPGMGVAEPVTGSDDQVFAESGEAAVDPTRSMNILPRDRFVFLHFFMTTTKLVGHLVAFYEDDEQVRFKGVLHDPTQAEPIHLEVAEAKVSVKLLTGTRRFEHVTVSLLLSDGRTVTIDNEPVGASIAMPGLGYSGGYHDGRGLGVWRGDTHIETDVWDVSHPEDVVYEDGSVRQHLHRLQPVRVSVSGGGVDGSGMGSTTFVFGGDLPASIDELA